MFFAVRFAMTSYVCFVSSCTLSPQFLKMCGSSYDIAYSCHTKIIQKTPIFTIKFTLNFFLSPLSSALLFVMLLTLVLKLPLKVLLVIADYLGIS